MGVLWYNEDMSGEKGTPANLLTVEEVAQTLRVNRKTVERLIRMGRLRAIRIGRLWRIPRESLDELLLSPLEDRER